jgi:DNA-binding MurR/RpiR family transcriptional regulator
MPGTVPRTDAPRTDGSRTDVPADYEDLIRVIHERFAVMSKTYQKISVYLTHNPNAVAVKSVNAIADLCGSHPSSLVRYAQALGYNGFKELQVLFQRRLETAAPGFEARVRALDNDLERLDDRSDYGFLRDLVVKDIAALQELLEETSTEDLGRASEMLLAAETVYLIGQLRSAPVVEFLRYILTMIGKRCVLLDPSGGLSTHMARTMAARDVLLAVSFRYYANEVVTIAEDAARSGVRVIAISDSTLSPLAKSAEVLFPVPERQHTFSRSLAAPICLAQALVLGTAARMQGDPQSPRIPTVTET